MSNNTVDKWEAKLRSELDDFLKDHGYLYKKYEVINKVMELLFDAQQKGREEEQKRIIRLIENEYEDVIERAVLLSKLSKGDKE